MVTVAARQSVLEAELAGTDMATARCVLESYCKKWGVGVWSLNATLRLYQLAIKEPGVWMTIIYSWHAPSTKPIERCLDEIEHSGHAMDQVAALLGAVRGTRFEHHYSQAGWLVRVRLPGG